MILEKIAEYFPSIKPVEYCNAPADKTTVVEVAVPNVQPGDIVVFGVKI